MCEEWIIPPHPSRDSGGEYLLMTLTEKKKKEKEMLHLKPNKMNFTTGREKEVGKGPYPNRAALGLGHGLRHSNSKVFFFFHS